MRYVVCPSTPSVRKCAFYRNWYDPTNSVIATRPGRTHWDYEPTAKKKCLYLGRETVARSNCSQFKLKDL